MPIDVQTLPELLDLDARGIDPDAVALSDGAEVFDYGDYAGRVGRVATGLVRLGVRPGDRVGVHFRKSVHSFVAVHGVLRAGAVMVPLDPLAPVDHVVSVLVDCAANVVLTDARATTVESIVSGARLAGVITRTTTTPPAVGGAEVLSWSELDQLDIAPLLAARPDDDAFIIYTSGSTGRPKGIVHTHRSALAYVRLAAAAYGLRVTDRMANIAGLHFDQSTFELYAAPYVGCAVTVVPDAVLRFPASLSELVEREQVTVWYSVPYVLRQLLTRGALDVRDLTSIRWVLYGGESFPPAELAELMRALPNAVISNVYGPAEVNQCMRFDISEPPVGDDPIPIGRAWDDTELVVVDAVDEPVVDGPGELLVATTTMMNRYWNRPDLTAQSIVERQFSGCAAERWYRTGDLVERVESSGLVFLGRVDNQVKIRGQRIELEAIDLSIRQLVAVADVASVVMEDATGERGVVAVVQCVSDSTVTLRDVQRHVGKHLPRVAVPVDVVTVSALARTGTAKVDRNAALEQASAAQRR